VRFQGLRHLIVGGIDDVGLEVASKCSREKEVLFGEANLAPAVLVISEVVAGAAAQQDREEFLRGTRWGNSPC